MTTEPLILDQVQQALAHRTPLRIRAGGSKDFYGRSSEGEILDLSAHHGILSYEPAELVLTARAGTPLMEIQAALAANGQMLPFEPPAFSPAATLGGVVAAGLSGPRRPWGGSVRDAVLGVKIINGKGEVLRFGGQVMKNVAGYDLSRLMVGALGTLGALLEISAKVLPRPAAEFTRSFELAPVAVAEKLAEWSRRPLPLSATCYHAGRLHVRLSGGRACLDGALALLGGEAGDPALWPALADQQLPFFQGELPLWRIALPAAAPALNLPGETLVEWAGALRWLATDLSAKALRQRVASLGGHATLFRSGQDKSAVFHPLSPALLALHQRLKQALDPAGLFNPGRLYPEF